MHINWLFHLTTPFKLKTILTHLVFEETRLQETEICSQKMVNIDSHRSAFVYFRSLFRQQNCPIGWCSNGSWIRNIKQIIVCEKESLRFFMDYYDHSKYIADIMRKGFDRQSGILGDCKYNRGAIEIQYPKEPEIEGIGLARHHLQNGYPHIWELKKETESASRTILSEIENLKNDFDSKITAELEKKTKTGTILIRKNDYISTQSEVFQSCYYNGLIYGIFDEIKMRKVGKQPRELDSDFDFLNNNQTVYKLSLGGIVLLRVKEEDKDEIKSRIESLLLNTDLCNQVSRYNQLNNNLNTDKTRLDFFNWIDNLRKSIFIEGESLVKKQNCKQCPLETF
jgi:hypothetical protein